MKTDHIIMLISSVRQEAYRFLTRELAQRDMAGLAPSHGAILSTLFDREPVRMQELAKEIDRDKSTVTVLVKKLVEYGYVEKAEDSMDGRVSMICLTERGRALRSDFDEISQRLISTAFRGFDQHERESLVRGLEKMLASYREESNS
jgi:DNA-binding MarR family transcriptional regulator